MDFFIASLALFSCIACYIFFNIDAPLIILTQWFLVSNIWAATYFLYRQKSQKKD
jgi:hypothetical protein